MKASRDEVPRHESVDHEHPTDAGMLDNDQEHVPGTGVLGDETLVREIPGGLHLDPPAAEAPRRHARPHPGPTPVSTMEQADTEG